MSHNQRGENRRRRSRALARVRRPDYRTSGQGRCLVGWGSGHVVDRGPGVEVRAAPPPVEWGVGPFAGWDRWGRR